MSQNKNDEFMLLLEGAEKPLELNLLEPKEERAQALAEFFPQDIIFIR